MVYYDIRLYTDKGVCIHDRGAECKPAEIPEILACIVLDYLEGSPYPCTMQAQVLAGRRCTEYVLLLKGDSLDVYRRVEAAARVGARELSRHQTGSATSLDKEDAGR